MLRDISKEKKSYSLIKRLNYLVNNYSFDKSYEVINQKEYMIYIYNENSINDISTYLQNNLNKLGIKSFIGNKESLKDDINRDKYQYYIKFNQTTSCDTVTINNKDYVKISFILNSDNPNYLDNEKIIKKMNDYLNTNYLDLSKGIIKQNNNSYYQDLNKNTLLMEIGCVDNNQEMLNNSTEIIALMLYNFLGDKK